MLQDRSSDPCLCAPHELSPPNHHLSLGRLEKARTRIGRGGTAGGASRIDTQAPQTPQQTLVDPAVGKPKSSECARRKDNAVRQFAVVDHRTATGGTAHRFHFGMTAEQVPVSDGDGFVASEGESCGRPAVEAHGALARTYAKRERVVARHVGRSREPSVQEDAPVQAAGSVARRGRPAAGRIRERRHLPAA